jgi:hypothetical protein
MKTLKSFLFALLLGTGLLLPSMTAPQAVAQVTEIDARAAMSSIMNAGRRADQVKSIKKVPSVGVVRLDFWPMPTMGSDIPSWQEYKIMVQKNSGGVNKLRRALMANPVTRAALAKNRVADWQVAGAQISSNGSLRLYIFSKWDRRP